MDNPNIVVIGATGTVGTIFLDLLEKRNFPVSKFVPIASKESSGKPFIFKKDSCYIITLEKFIVMDLLLPFSFM